MILINFCCEFFVDKYSCFHDAKFFSSIIIALSIFKTFWTNSTIFWRFFSINEKFWKRILIIREKIVVSNQKKSFYKYILTTVFRNLSETTKKHCLKSSQKQTIFSSKKIISFTSQISEKIRLTIMKFHFRCAKNKYVWKKKHDYSN